MSILCLVRTQDPSEVGWVEIAEKGPGRLITPLLVGALGGAPILRDLQRAADVW